MVCQMTTNSWFHLRLITMEIHSPIKFHLRYMSSPWRWLTSHVAMATTHPGSTWGTCGGGVCWEHSCSSPWGVWWWWWWHTGAPVNTTAQSRKQVCYYSVETLKHCTLWNFGTPGFVLIEPLLPLPQWNPPYPSGPPPPYNSGTPAPVEQPLTPPQWNPCPSGTQIVLVGTRRLWKRILCE